MKRAAIILLIVLFAFVCFSIIVFAQKKDLCINGKCTQYWLNLQNPILRWEGLAASDKKIDLMPIHVVGMRDHILIIGMMTKSGVGEKLMKVQVIHNGGKKLCVLGMDSVSHESLLLGARVYDDIDCVFELTGDDYVRISYLCKKCKNDDFLAIESGRVPLLSPMIIDLKSYLVQRPQGNKTTNNSN